MMTISRVLTAVMFCIIAVGSGSVTAAALSDRKIDDQKPITQLQILGSHNSYKSGPNPAAQAYWGRAFSGQDRVGGYPELDYGHPSLTQQLDLGIRQLEIDPYADSKGGLYAAPYEYDRAAYAVMSAPGAKVLHIPLLDSRVSCLTLAQCLTEIDVWSNGHPGHLMLLVLINPQEIGPKGSRLDLEPMSLTSLDEFDATARRVFGSKLITPDEIRGTFPSLRQAAMAGNWPNIDQSRGRILLTLDTGPILSDLYRKDHPSLRGRALFAFYPEDESEAAIFNIQDPLAHEGQIRTLVTKGFLVRTRSDADTFEARDYDYRRLHAAQRSGAQYISTDFYPSAGLSGTSPLSAGFKVDLDTELVRLNPVTAHVSPAIPDHLRVEKIIDLYRHSIRTPLADEKGVTAYIDRPFPEWLGEDGRGLEEGMPTEHGREALRLAGRAERQELIEQGFVHADRCPAENAITIKTSPSLRAVDGGHILAETLFPGCAVPVEHLPPDRADPLFQPIQAGQVDFDPARAIKAVLTYTGGFDHFLAPHQSALSMLEHVLGCSPMATRACHLASIPTQLTVNSDGRGINIEGGLRHAAGAAQILLLQYAQGLPMDEVGWGQVDVKLLGRVSRFHGLLVSALNRPPYLADRISGPLALRIAQDMESTDRRIAIYVGHDGNLAALAARLGLHFKVPGYGYDDPPIGAALRLTVLRDSRGKRYVSATLRAQTPDQLRELSTINSASPLYAELMEIETCSVAPKQYCPLSQVVKRLRAAPVN